MYRIVLVYAADENATFLGYTLKQEGVDKLHNNNLWSQDDLEDITQQCARLNAATNILQFWPDVRDPEVQELINDPTWEPLKLSAVEVVDEDRSNFVWLEEPSDNNPYGRMDEENSDLVFKHINVPAPTDVQARVKRACEVVARERAGLK